MNTLGSSQTNLGNRMLHGQWQALFLIGQACQSNQAAAGICGTEDVRTQSAFRDIFRGDDRHGILRSLTGVNGGFILFF